MLRDFGGVAAVASLALVSAGAAEAIVINDTAGLSVAENLGANSVFDSVVRISDGTYLCSGALVSSTAPANEGLIGRGDSGGPLLFFRDGSLVMAGVLTGYADCDGDNLVAYGDAACWTGFHSEEAQAILTAAGATFYTASVPLPATATAVLEGFGLMIALRRGNRG